MNAPKRYHPALVTLHWLTVILLFASYFLSESGRRSPISIHMVLGSLLLVVLIARVVVRLTTKHPAWADTGNPILNKLGELVHYGLYASAFLVLGMGGAMAYNRNLFAYLIDPASPVGKAAGVFRGLHEITWMLVVLLTFAHVGAALYHQFIIKDNLLARMWYGK